MAEFALTQLSRVASPTSIRRCAPKSPGLRGRFPTQPLLPGMPAPEPYRHKPRRKFKQLTISQKHREQLEDAVGTARCKAFIHLIRKLARARHQKHIREEDESVAADTMPQEFVFSEITAAKPAICSVWARRADRVYDLLGTLNSVTTPYGRRQFVFELANSVPGKARMIRILQ